MSYQDVKRIGQEMSLRAPLTDALKSLDKTFRDLEEYETALENVPSVGSVTGKTFETDFPSFCFHIATGVGKTRLLGACIAYLYRTQGWTDFFILVPGATIYNKFQGSDFRHGGSKFLFAGLEDFPDFNLITADNYRQITQTGLFDAPINIYLFNIGKIFEGKKDKTFKFSREDADGLGLEYKEGFASYLAERRPVILMDEAHRYYAPASLNAMNRLKPRLGLEFTATPTFSGNILSRFNLGQAIDAGYVKHPRVTRVINDDTPENEKEAMLLLDATRNHERKKGVLEAYCINNGLDVVKPILLVTAKDTTEGDAIAAYLEGKAERYGAMFGAGTDLEGRYAGKVLLVHSKTEDDTDNAVKTLENGPYEIVVHVNKLKEGLDVSTIYTLAVLRASSAAVLTEQIIGRGLRLPFGQPVSEEGGLPEEVADLNALDIMPHKEYAKVVAEADDYLKGRIQERELDRKQKEPSLQEIVTVAPSDAPERKIAIPIIESEVINTGQRLAVFPITPGVEFTGGEDFHRRIVYEDMQSKVVTLTETFAPLAVSDATTYLVRATLELLPETDADDAPVLRELAHAYLTQHRPQEADWPAFVPPRRNVLLTDFLGLIKSQLDTLHPAVQVRRAGEFAFSPWSKSVPIGYVAPLRADDDPAQEKVGVLIDGYIKSLYPKNHFDSKHEKWLADCLERDASVIRWVRLPTRQLRIGLTRSGYYPDFVAVRKEKDGTERFYLLEVKAANKCDPNKPDPDVFAKFRAAKDWVRKANQGEEDPAKWQYRLLPDAVIGERRKDDFVFLLDGARTL